MQSRTMFRSMAVAAALALAGLTGAQAADRPTEREQLAAGTWYGEYSQPTRKAVQKFITTRSPDGAFTIHARLYEGGRVVADLHNSGIWGVSNGMYFTVTTEIDGRKTDARTTEVINAYLVQKLEANEFEYVHVASGNRFRVVRVDPAGARLPD